MNGILYDTIEQITKATGGKLVNHNIDLPAPAYLSIDSRKIISPADTIFFAIKTTHRDGNDFIEGLYQRGVRNFVTASKEINIKKNTISKYNSGR